MDHDAVLAHPIGQVFGHLADPARLGDWLPAATAIHVGHGAAAFTLRLSRDPAQPAAGELIGCEPPRQLAYRLRASWPGKPRSGSRAPSPFPAARPASSGTRHPQSALVPERAEGRPATSPIRKDTMFTQLYQRQDTARATARALTSNHSRAVARTVNANHAGAVARLINVNHSRAVARVINVNHSRAVARLVNVNHARAVARILNVNHSRAVARVVNVNHSRAVARILNCNHSRAVARLINSNHSRAVTRILNCNHSRAVAAGRA